MGRDSRIECQGVTSRPFDMNTLLRSRLFINTRLMEVVHHVLKEVDSCRYEALSLHLCVQTVVGLQNQHNANAFLCR